ncbi:hypothetical protein BC941DRAFT_409289 [Chlamydoabsidia padenii]|nr:hypothetical protein BC941DRAFT_409289 [Chlamydoabsidia padenii]
MGCCGSKSSHEEDNVHAPLINKSTTDRHPEAPPIDRKKEQEFWKQVIDRTSQNLIDISNAPAEPLQEQDIHARMVKYRELLQQVTVQKRSWDNTQWEEVSEEPVDLPWLDQAMIDIQHAIDQIKVEYKGDLVIRMAHHSLH